MFLRGGEVKVYSFVVSVPFSPIDIDLGRLARGEWNALTDRFRIWYLPGEGGDASSHSSHLCYVMIRKLDPQSEVLTYAHVVISLASNGEGGGNSNYMVGILSNDDVRAKSMLNAMLEIPPAFHRRSELRLIERRWRSDPDAVLRFTANIHATAAQPEGGGGVVYKLKFQLPPEISGQFTRNMATWWQNPQG
jgi:hypothetical protein